MYPISVRASAEERRRAFPGDALLEDAIATWTHGVTIAAPPGAIWPWLAQMGAGRAGWYSWDLLDNGGHPSAGCLHPEWERLEVGDVLPAGPGVTGMFEVEAVEPGRDLVLGVPLAAGGVGTTWEFLLDPLPADRTRLLVRARVGARGWMAPVPGERSGGVRSLLARVPRGPVLAAARAVHRVMQARQLRSIRRRVEARAAPGLLVNARGMNLVGQGLRIMLFTAPALAAAVLAHLAVPDLVRLPGAPSVLRPAGLALLGAGLALWATAVLQLLAAFRRGALVTSGAYAVCRNPIYASVALLALPGVALATGTWAYLVPAAVLCGAVWTFIGHEERELERAFGDPYRRYLARVHRLLPLVRPRGRGR